MTVVYMQDHAKRRSAHMTMRDRKRLRQVQQQRPEFSVEEHRRRADLVNRIGWCVIGALYGAGLLWVLNLWVTVGGAP